MQDGREVEADAIVLATGYGPLKDTLRKIVGDDVADKCTVGVIFSEDKEIAGVSSVESCLYCPSLIVIFRCVAH